MEAYSEPTVLQRVPRAVRETLERGDKSGKRLSDDQVLAVAEGLLRCGIGRADCLGWMAKLIRHKLGVGDYASPPEGLVADALAYRLAQDRAAEIVDAVRTRFRELAA
jgi:hypothetical protein